MRFPNESDEYRAARERLLEQELVLRRQMEAVAVARRALPPGGLVLEDYVFRGQRADGVVGDVRLSEQFTAGDTLIVYQMMFPRSRADQRPGPTAGATAALPLHEGPCPSCTALIDQLDSATRHLAHRLNVVIVAKTSFERLADFAAEREWRYMRLLSAAANTFKRDYGGEDDDGAQEPMLNVFQRTPEGIRHTWSSELLYAPTDPGQEMRHVGTIEPMWNLLDYTPGGRGDAEEQLAYEGNAATSGCCH